VLDLQLDQVIAVLSQCWTYS